MNAPNPSEWGQPIIVATRGTDIEYRCGECNAGWVGPSDDYCEWCHNRWLVDIESQRNRLLFPEWLSWGDRYFACSEIDRRVWANTRGFIGDFEATWMDRLTIGFESGMITEAETLQSVERWHQWQANGRSKVSNDFFDL